MKKLYELNDGNFEMSNPNNVKAPRENNPTIGRPRAMRTTVSQLISHQGVGVFSAGSTGCSQMSLLTRIPPSIKFYFNLVNISEGALSSR